ncbi:hypothetical protein C3Y98_00935 [Methylotenera oryzisoli]|uniref:DUF2059 domain-containing protein n=1 Tax=Methylotenera oryzisoli TaxID=2080758 RepID=A0A4Y9VUD7_9PROT|nr:hypothetical protein [Methylotenera oryzisoli]TFW72956.1 hypothetical protein C3Y98_00935 [Methylotenera oryzisoli]
MKKFISHALVFLSLVSTLSVGASSEDVALNLVQKYRFGQNLTPISYQVASQTQTYRMIVNKVGEQKAQSIVKSEIDKVIPEYQNQWNKNLASSYAQVISPEKLQSLVDEGPSSKYSGELKTKQSEIGPLMQSKSKDLLNEMLTKAMTSAFNQIVPK